MGVISPKFFMKAKKSLGQNFLIDKNVISKIVTEISACNDDLIVEIGPGRGALTKELKKYNSGDLKFTHKRINNKMIEEYTKYFVYKDNTFMSVKPSENGYPSGYYEHIKQYNYKVDHINKIILFTDSEVEEVEPIKEEFYSNKAI